MLRCTWSIRAATRCARAWTEAASTSSGRAEDHALERPEQSKPSEAVRLGPFGAAAAAPPPAEPGCRSCGEACCAGCGGEVVASDEDVPQDRPEASGTAPTNKAGALVVEDLQGCQLPLCTSGETAAAGVPRCTLLSESFGTGEGLDACCDAAHGPSPRGPCRTDGTCGGGVAALRGETARTCFEPEGAETCRSNSGWGLCTIVCRRIIGLALLSTSKADDSARDDLGEKCSQGKPVKDCSTGCKALSSFSRAATTPNESGGGVGSGLSHAWYCFPTCLGLLRTRPPPPPPPSVIIACRESRRARAPSRRFPPGDSVTLPLLRADMGGPSGFGDRAVLQGVSPSPLLSDRHMRSAQAHTQLSSRPTAPSTGKDPSPPPPPPPPPKPTPPVPQRQCCGDEVVPPRPGVWGVAAQGEAAPTAAPPLAQLPPPGPSLRPLGFVCMAPPPGCPDAWGDGSARSNPPRHQPGQHNAA
mmetsp:Transcript_56176/g.182311  ORF Transcript_56176/g.182311 Transcript_56176/m.182311 type:complete len:472 (+) Transcript_56176:432-1847(+)